MTATQNLIEAAGNLSQQIQKSKTETELALLKQKQEMIYALAECVRGLEPPIEKAPEPTNADSSMLRESIFYDILIVLCEHAAGNENTAIDKLAWLIGVGKHRAHDMLRDLDDRVQRAAQTKWTHSSVTGISKGNFNMQVIKNRQPSINHAIQSMHTTTPALVTQDNVVRAVADMTELHAKMAKQAAGLAPDGSYWDELYSYDEKQGHKKPTKWYDKFMKGKKNDKK